MAMIGLRVPHEVARLLQTIEVGGEKVDSGSYHLTLLYLGDEVGIDEITKATAATYGAVGKTRPFTVRLDRVSSFPPNDNGVPIICPVKGRALTDLRRRLVRALDKMGVGYDTRFPTFRPHVTLGYGEGDAPKDRPLYPIEWGVTEVVLWGGDHGDDKLTVTFPLELR